MHFYMLTIHITLVRIIVSMLKDFLSIINQLIIKLTLMTLVDVKQILMDLNTTKNTISFVEVKKYENIFPFFCSELKNSLAICLSLQLTYIVG